MMSECELKMQVPIYIKVGKKNYSLNLNVYRNMHHHVSNNIKQQFKNVVGWSLIGRKFNKIEIEYTVFPKVNRPYDVSNICAIVDKFFSDALVSVGAIEDDNFNFIPKVTYKWGGHCKENPRCEVRIIPL